MFLKACLFPSTPYVEIPFIFPLICINSLRICSMTVFWSYSILVFDVSSLSFRQFDVICVFVHVFYWIFSEFTFQMLSSFLVSNQKTPIPFPLPLLLWGCSLAHPCTHPLLAWEQHRGRAQHPPESREKGCKLSCRACALLGLFTNRTRAGTALFQAIFLLITPPPDRAKPRLRSLPNPTPESPRNCCGWWGSFSAKDLGSSVPAPEEGKQGRGC